MRKRVYKTERMPEIVQKGDFVRVYLNGVESEYKGYCWANPPTDEFIEQLKEQGQLLSDLETDVLFASIPPHGKTSFENDGNTNFLLDNIQYVGVNLEKETLGGQRASRFEILGKPSY